MNHISISAISVFCLTSCFLGCTEETPRSSPTGNHDNTVGVVADGVVTLSEEASQLAEITIAEIGLRKCNHVLKRTGKVLAPLPQTAIISHAFSARIAEVHVGVGQPVSKGQPLVTLECQEVGEVKSEFYKTQAELDLAKINLAREERLLESGIGVKKDLVAAQNAHRVAQAASEAAEKKLHVFGFNEEQVRQLAETHQINPTITLYSPIDGKVVANSAVRGALVDQLTEILKIIDLSRLWVDAEVFEKDIAKVKVGQKVTITVPAYPDEVFHGDITFIGDLVDETTRTMTVRAEVANADGRLKPGLFADVEISLNGNKKVLAVPTVAVLEEGDLKVVFVKEQGGEYKRREIEAGFCDGEYQHVISGLEVGEKVVVKGNHQLRSELREDQLHHGHAH